MMSSRVLTADSRVLLTGATGLIGGELLRGLLQFGVPLVWTLVRAGSSQHALRRICTRLRRSNSELDGLAAILEAVPGDMRKPHLGLGFPDRGRIAERVDLIIHCASETSFIRDEDCRETNIAGMRNLTAFADECPRRPLVVYISTASNSGAVRHCTLHEDQGANIDAAHHNEYTRSKAVAEQQLKISGVDFLILRPSVVLSAGIPDRVFARSVLWFVPLLRQFKGVPVDPLSRFDVLPVGHVCESILKLLQKPQRAYDTYHLSAGPRAATTCGSLSLYLDNFYNRKDPLRLVRPDVWTNEVRRRFVASAHQRRVFSTFRYYLPFLNMDVVYENQRLQSELGDDFIQVPKVELYIGELLQQISVEEAVAESARP